MKDWRGSGYLLRPGQTHQAQIWHCGIRHYGIWHRHIHSCQTCAP